MILPTPKAPSVTIRKTDENLTESEADAIQSDLNTEIIRSGHD